MDDLRTELRLQANSLHFWKARNSKSLQTPIHNAFKQSIWHQRLHPFAASSRSSARFPIYEPPYIRVKWLFAHAMPTSKPLRKRRLLSCWNQISIHGSKQHLRLGGSRCHKRSFYWKCRMSAWKCAAGTFIFWLYYGGRSTSLVSGSCCHSWWKLPTLPLVFQKYAQFVSSSA